MDARPIQTRPIVPQTLRSKALEKKQYYPPFGPSVLTSSYSQPFSRFYDFFTEDRV